MSLLNKKPRVPLVPEHMTAWVSIDCPSVSSTWLPLCLECPRALGVLSDCLSSALWVPKCPLSAVLGKKVYKINGLLHSYIEFFKTFHNTYLNNIIFCFIRNKMCKVYHVLLATYSKWKLFRVISKTFLKYFMKFQKTKYEWIPELSC